MLAAEFAIGVQSPRGSDAALRLQRTICDGIESPGPAHGRLVARIRVCVSAGASAHAGSAFSSCTNRRNRPPSADHVLCAAAAAGTVMCLRQVNSAMACCLLA